MRNIPPRIVMLLAALLLVELLPGWDGARPAWAQAADEDAASGTKLAQMLDYVQLRIVAGRVVASSNRRGISFSTESSNLAAAHWERLTLDLSNPAPGLRYERKTAKDETVIEISDGDHLVARRVPKKDPAVIELEQLPGELVLTLGTGAQRRIVRAPTLWHLLLTEPDATRRQLIPLVEMLSPSWKLAAKVDQIEAALLRWAQLGEHFDRARLARLVQGLGDAQFAARRAAERELAEIGEPALMYLAALRRSDLDAEQWQRVQTLLGTMSGAGEDTVDRSVGWLAGDPNVWLALLERDSVSVRQAAAGQLRHLLDRSIDFDPSAPADERAAQIVRLRAGIEKQEAAEVQPAENPEPAPDADTGSQ